jgi:hypothetical protein
MEVEDGGTHYSRRYADLAGCQEAVRGALAVNSQREDQMNAGNAKAAEDARVGRSSVTMTDYIHVSAYCIPVSQ